MDRDWASGRNPHATKRPAARGTADRNRKLRGRPNHLEHSQRRRPSGSASQKGPSAGRLHGRIQRAVGSLNCMRPEMKNDQPSDQPETPKKWIECPYFEAEVDPICRMYLHIDMPSAKNRAKLFRHGGSQAARLPREFRLPGTEVAISRTPNGGVLLEALGADFEARRRRFISLAGSCPDLPDVPPHSTSDIPRDE